MHSGWCRGVFRRVFPVASLIDAWYRHSQTAAEIVRQSSWRSEWWLSPPYCLPPSPALLSRHVARLSCLAPPVPSCSSWGLSLALVLCVGEVLSSSLVPSVPLLVSPDGLVPIRSARAETAELEVPAPDVVCSHCIIIHQNCTNLLASPPTTVLTLGRRVTADEMQDALAGL